jgi:CubicO group peptidase (beta-lactamase class C family)
MGALNWAQAGAAADTVATGWEQEGGPGGAIVLFGRDGIGSIHEGGYASLETRRKFTADTACRFASVSKHFLCSLLLREGVIGLDETLGAYLPLSEAIGAVTVGRALDMTGGIPDAMETLWLLGVPPTSAMDRHALLRFVSRFDATNFPPGTEISYSNSGYRLVQAALERNGRGYFDALHERFFGPLGLSIALPEDWSEPVDTLATGYWREGAVWRRGQYGLHFSASGGLTGTARDLATWAGALLAGRGPVAGLLDGLIAPRRLADGRETAYGLGLTRQTMRGHVLVGHGGSLPGYKTHLLMHPDSGAGIALVSNREDTVAAMATLRIMAALLGMELPPAAETMLPAGRFVTDTGPFWLESAPGGVTFLGSQEQLFDFGDGAATGLSAHMPVRLHRDGDGIAGEIGHVARRFRPVPADAAIDPRWSGVWALERENARFEIDGGTLRMGVGPLTESVTLEPLGGARALMSHGQGGPSKQRVCLVFDGDEVRLVANRSRVLGFRRVG